MKESKLEIFNLDMVGDCTGPGYVFRGTLKRVSYFLDENEEHWDDRDYRYSTQTRHRDKP